MAANRLRVAHQLYLGRIADMDLADIGLLEIPVGPEGICVDQRDLILTDIGAVAGLGQ